MRYLLNKKTKMQQKLYVKYQLNFMIPGFENNKEYLIQVCVNVCVYNTYEYVSHT